MTSDGNCLTVCLTAHPVEGKANEQLLRLLKEYLAVPTQQMEIIAGKSSRRKLVRVNGITQEKLDEILRKKMEIIAANGS